MVAQLRLGLLRRVRNQRWVTAIRDEGRVGVEVVAAERLEGGVLASDFRLVAFFTVDTP